VYSKKIQKRFASFKKVRIFAPAFEKRQFFEKGVRIFLIFDFRFLNGAKRKKKSKKVLRIKKSIIFAPSNLIYDFRSTIYD